MVFRPIQSFLFGSNYLGIIFRIFLNLACFNPSRARFCSFKLNFAVSWISTAAVSAPASTTAVSSAVSTATAAARGCGQSGPLLPRTDCCGLRYAHQQYTVHHIHSNISCPWLWSISPLTIPRSPGQTVVVSSIHNSNRCPMSRMQQQPSVVAVNQAPTYRGCTLYSTVVVYLYSY
jgi:hypothetical protein